MRACRRRRSAPPGVPSGRRPARARHLAAEPRAGPMAERASPARRGPFRGRAEAGGALVPATRRSRRSYTPSHEPTVPPLTAAAACLDKGPAVRRPADRAAPGSCASDPARGRASPPRAGRSRGRSRAAAAPAPSSLVHSPRVGAKKLTSRSKSASVKSRSSGASPRTALVASRSTAIVRPAALESAGDLVRQQDVAPRRSRRGAPSSERSAGPSRAGGRCATKGVSMQYFVGLAGPRASTPCAWSTSAAP